MTASDMWTIHYEDGSGIASLVYVAMGDVPEVSSGLMSKGYLVLGFCKEKCKE